MLKLSIAATALGMALVILSITSGKGLQQAIMTEFARLEGDMTISAYSPTRTEELRPILLRDSLLMELDTSSYVEAVFASVHKMALLVNPEDDAFDGVQLTGYDSAQLAYFQQNNPLIEAAPDLQPGAGPQTRYGAFVSTALAEALGLGIGDTAVLTVMRSGGELPRLRKAKIEGLFRTALEEFDRGHILMNIDDVRRLNGWRHDSVSAYTVVLSDREHRSIYADYWNATVPFDVQVRSIESRHPAIFGWLELFDTNILLVLSIVLIVAVSNLMTALLVLIIDRTPMVGTLKAMGASNRLILQVFQWMSLRILGRGLLWGNLLGLGMSFVQWQWGLVKLDPETYYIAQAPIAFDGWWILGANFTFILLAYLILLLPVRWIAKLDPVRSIKFS